jgi:Domain of unknown function (DUF6798)
MIKNRKIISFFIIFFILLFLYLWDDILSGNEAQTLANVYNFAHPGWLANDWFLSLDTVYRIPFNIFLFPLAKFLSLPLLAISARVLLIGLMSLALTKFFAIIKLTPGSITLFILIAFRMKGILAGEDMLWHVEAKILSYIFVIGGLSSFLEGKYRKMWLFFGAATTFHPLVGGYSVISLLFAWFFLEKKDKKIVFNNSLFFVLSGWPGMGIVLYNLISSRAASGGISDLIYVARHPHHMLPTNFIRHVHKGFPEWIDYTIIITNLIFCIAVITAAFFVIKKDSLRKLLYFTAGSGVIFIIGLLFYVTKQYHLLKYYPFRFGDIIIPFTAYILFLTGIDKYLFIKKALWGRITAIAVLTITGVLFTMETGSVIKNDIPIEMLGEQQAEIELYTWIQENTPKNAVFIISPFIDNFNITSNRAQFVTFKHIPQNERDVIAWYEKLTELNNGLDFYDGGISLDLSEFTINYNSLSDKKLLVMGTKYKLDYYVGTADRNGNLERVYFNDKWGIYNLNE